MGNYFNCRRIISKDIPQIKNKTRSQLTSESELDYLTDYTGLNKRKLKLTLDELYFKLYKSIVKLEIDIFSKTNNEETYFRGFINAKIILKETKNIKDIKYIVENQEYRFKFQDVSFKSNYWNKSELKFIIIILEPIVHSPNFILRIDDVHYGECSINVCSGNTLNKYSCICFNNLHPRVICKKVVREWTSKYKQPINRLLTWIGFAQSIIEFVILPFVFPLDCDIPELEAREWWEKILYY